MAIGLVANACFVWITDIRLERQLAEIRAAGEPITLADLAHKPIPPEKNAATYLRQAEAEVEAINNEVYCDPDYLHGWGKVWNGGQFGLPLPPNGIKAVRKALTAHPKTILLLEQAAACPDYDAGFGYTCSPGTFIVRTLPGNQVFRRSGDMLQFRAYLLAAEGNYDEAVRTALVISRLGRLYERNPGLVPYLIAITLQGTANDAVNLTLHTGPVAKAVRNALDAELTLQDRMDGFLWAMESSRPIELDWFQAYPMRSFWLINRGLWNQRTSDYLDQMQVVLPLLRKSSPYRETRKAFGTPVQSIPDDKRMDLLVKQPFLWYGPVYESVTGHRAKVRSLRVLNALQAHVPAGSKTIPKLSELGLPAETTTDPFTDEPLHVTKLPQGWLVYSVGRNLRDDGGKLDYGPDCDVGVGPPPCATGSASASVGTSQEITHPDKR